MISFHAQLSRGALLAATALLLNCSSAKDAPEANVTGKFPMSASADGLKLVSAFRAERGSNAILQNEPGTANVQRLREACQSGRSLVNVNLGVYQLAPVENTGSRITAQATELGMPASAKPQVASASIPALVPWMALQSGAYKLVFNTQSGAESFVNTDLFHKGPGAKTILSDDEYLTRANSHLDFISAKDQVIAISKLYPYKLRRYMNAVATQGGTPDVSVYQVAVVYNDTIDDIPVIGSGGKVAIHMTIDGRIAGHENTVRAIKSKTRDLQWADLTCPDIAQQEVERSLTTRGKTLSHYKLVRMEFGYLREGRHSLQSVVAPHYAFIYEPLPGILAKKLVETIPATGNAAIRAILEKDAKLDEDRKATIGASVDMSARR
jgi:hypothetical protein